MTEEQLKDIIVSALVEAGWQLNDHDYSRFIKLTDPEERHYVCLEWAIVHPKPRT